MGSLSKSKGSAFERTICKALSTWVSRGEREDLFWRSAMSGGRATVHKDKGKVADHAGDITATSEAGHKLTNQFYIECKFYKDLNIDGFLFGTGNLHKFWQKCKEEANQYGKAPMLIAKQNRTPVLVVFHMDSDPVAQDFHFATMDANVYLFDELMKTEFEGESC